MRSALGNPRRVTVRARWQPAGHAARRAARPGGLMGGDEDVFAPTAWSAGCGVLETSADLAVLFAVVSTFATARCRGNW
ncbi:MAG: hypothetical protein IPH23_12400 [Gammaproteobacteria bacterium]|nr:hypothetical protein [Gammaproteobacteria bacterium]